MFLIIVEVNYGDIGDDDFTCHVYYIIIFSSFPYTLQSYFNIYGQVISSDEILCEVAFYFTININYHNYVSTENKSNKTIVYLRKIINFNVNVICYDSNYVVASYLISISQKYSSSLTPLHVPMEKMII